MHDEQARREEDARRWELIQESRRIVQESVDAIQTIRETVADSKRNLAHSRWLRRQRQRRSS